MSPRDHPTGLTGLGVSAVLLIAVRLHVDLTATEATTIVGLAVALVSKFTPRHPKESHDRS